MKLNTLKYSISILSLIGLLYLISLSFTSNLINFLNLKYIVVIYLLNVVPLIYYLYNKKEQDLIPLFYLIHFYILIFYTSFNFFYVAEMLSFVKNRGFGMDSTFSNLNDTNYILLIAILSFNIGYFIFFKIILFKRKSFKILDIKQPNEIFYLALLFVICPIILFYIIEIQYFKASLMMFKYPLVFMALGLINFYVINYNTKQNRYKKFILITLIAIIILQELMTSSLSFSFLLVAYSFVYIFFITKKINILFLSVVIFVMFITESYKYDYRAAIKFKSLNMFAFKNELNQNSMNQKNIYRLKSILLTKLPKLSSNEEISDTTLLKLSSNEETLDILFNETRADFKKDKILSEKSKKLIDTISKLTNKKVADVKEIILMDEQYEQYEGYYNVFYKKIIVDSYKDLTGDNYDISSAMTQSSKRFYHAYLSANIIIENTKDDEFMKSFKQEIKESHVRKVKYLKGDSYKLLISGLVPRMFWKDKPQDRFANEAGIRYGVLCSCDLVTSWNVPIISEMYMNFGRIGVFLGMLILGISTRLLTLIFTIPNRFNYESIIGFFCITPLFFIEVNSSIVFGSFMKNYIFLMVVMISYCFLKRFKTNIVYK